MNCAGCGHVDRDAAKLCEECGRALAGPGSEPLPSGPRGLGTYTPKHLADRILGDRAAMVGERRPLTVLFADIQGLMELAERIAAKWWHQLETTG